MVVIENESIVLLVQLISMLVVFLLFFIPVTCGSISRLEIHYSHSERFVELVKKADRLSSNSLIILLPITILIMLILGVGRFPAPLYFWVVIASILTIFEILQAVLQETELFEEVLSKNKVFKIFLDIATAIAFYFLWGISGILIPAFILPQL